MQELIRTALRQNYDLQLATERINAARAEVAVTRSSLFPQVSGNASFNEGKEIIQSKFNFLTLTADAAFQLDFFGWLRRATEAAHAQLPATEDARQTVMLTLVSDLASNYFTLLQLDLQLQITRQTVNTQMGSVKLTGLRLDRGVATKLDVLQAQQVLDTANSQIPDLERQIAQEENAISILLGDYPHDVARGFPLVQQTLPPEVPPGLPSSILERRPDIREAEEILIVERRNWSRQGPVFSANRSDWIRRRFFWAQQRLLQPHGSQIGLWSYGAQASQPVFTGGALRGNLRLAKSEHQQSLLAYRQTIQRAFGEVSDALIGYEKLHQVRMRQQDTVSDLEERVRISTLRYKGGTTTYLEVLDGQCSLYGAQLTLASARGDQYRSLVQLYKALGGGWQHLCRLQIPSALVMHFPQHSFTALTPAGPHCKFPISPTVSARSSPAVPVELPDGLWKKSSHFSKNEHANVAGQQHPAIN